MKKDTCESFQQHRWKDRNPIRMRLGLHHLRMILFCRRQSDDGKERAVAVVVVRQDMYGRRIRAELRIGTRQYQRTVKSGLTFSERRKGKGNFISWENAERRAKQDED